MHTRLARYRLRLLNRFARARDGATLIETAIVLPLALWLIMGIIEMGIVFYVSSLSNYAANEAARRGKTGFHYGYSEPREVMIRKTVDEYMNTWVSDPNEISFESKSFGDFDNLSASGIPGAGGAGNIVMYTITYRWKIFTPIFAQIIGDDGHFNIKARVLTKNEDFK